MSAVQKQMIDSFGRSQEDNKARQEIMEAANKDARENWDNPQWRAEFAADLTESILLGFDYETLVDQWIDTERTDFDGRIFVREATGLKAFYMARGGYIEASELSADISEVPRDMLGVHVWEFEDKFLTSFSESAQTLRDLSIKRMDSEINRRIHTVLKQALAAAYTTTAAGVTKPALDAAISRVQDESESGSVSIVGRPTMVNQIASFDGFGNETMEEIRRKGMIGVYHGCNIVSLKQHKDEDGIPYIPNNEMWILAKDTGKFAFFGGLKSKEFVELDNWYWHYLARRDTGIMVHHPERSQLFIDSSISPVN
jgi:hypothetical protein